MVYSSKDRVNVAILASGTGTNYDAIYKASYNGSMPNVQVVGLITNNSIAPARQKATQRGHATYWFDHTKYTREKLDERIVATLDYWNIDLVVFAGWMRIVTHVLVDSYKNRILNIHPSLLPSFKGHRAVELALEAGVKVTGCTVHVVEEAVDSGEILDQVAVPVYKDDDAETLHNRIKKVEYKLYPKTIELYAKKIGKRIKP